MDNKASEVIRTGLSDIWLGDDGIIRSIIMPGGVGTLETAKEAVVAYRKLGKRIARPVFMDGRKIKSVDRPSRVYAASEEASSVIRALGVLVASLYSRMLGNFFLKVSKPPYPTRLFTSEAEAMEWLRTFVE